MLFDYEISVKDAVNSIRFWHMFFMLLFGIFFGAYVNSVFKSAAIGKLSDKTLTIVGVFGRLSNGLARVVGGILLDWYRFKNIYFIIMINQI